MKVTADASGCGTAQQGVNTSDGERERDAVMVGVRRGGEWEEKEEDGVKKKKEWLAAEMPQQ